MIVIVGNQKGGCGKSTIIINICTYLVQRNNKILLIDADHQATVSTWINDRKTTNLSQIQCIQEYGNIKNMLIDLNKKYDFTIIDAAGHDSVELRSTLLVADVFILPFRPSQPDLDVLPKMQEIVVKAKKINPKLRAFGLLTMAPTNPAIHECQEAFDYFKDFPDIPLLKTIIYDRKVYRDSMSNGFGVIEMKNEKAKDEINNLAEELFNAKT